MAAARPTLRRRLCRLGGRSTAAGFSLEPSLLEGLCILVKFGGLCRLAVVSRVVYRGGKPRLNAQVRQLASCHAWWLGEDASCLCCLVADRRLRRALLYPGGSGWCTGEQDLQLVSDFARQPAGRRGPGSGGSPAGIAQAAAERGGLEVSIWIWIVRENVCRRWHSSFMPTCMY